MKREEIKKVFEKNHKQCNECPWHPNINIQDCRTCKIYQTKFDNYILTFTEGVFKEIDKGLVEWSGYSVIVVAVLEKLKTALENKLKGAER